MKWPSRNRRLALNHATRTATVSARHVTAGNGWARHQAEKPLGLQVLPPRRSSCCKTNSIIRGIPRPASDIHAAMSGAVHGSRRAGDHDPEEVPDLPLLCMHSALRGRQASSRRNSGPSKPKHRQFETAFSRCHSCPVLSCSPRRPRSTGLADRHGDLGALRSVEEYARRLPITLLPQHFRMMRSLRAARGYVLWFSGE